jgi:hypothetical protein
MASKNKKTKASAPKAAAKAKAKAKAKATKGKPAKAKATKGKPAKATRAKPANTARAKTRKSSAPATSAGGVRFNDLRALIGLPVDDARVSAVLARAGAKWGRPDGGQSYAVAKKAGFDLLAERPEDAKRGAPMLVHTVFMFREGHDGHRQFAAPPAGLSFCARAELLSTMPAPVHSWLIGDGEVPVDSPEVDHDTWHVDGVAISADYDSDQNVCTITASPPQAR